MAAERAETEKGTEEKLTSELVDRFLEDLLDRGRKPVSLQEYRRSLKMLYDYLPEGKEIGPYTGREWKESLEEQGLGPRTVNLRTSVWNSLVQYLGHMDWRVGDFLPIGEEVQPELTRTEYLRLLSAAKHLEQERTYFLIKVLGGTGLRFQELPLLTAEAVRQGSVRLERRKGMEASVLRLPGALQKELLEYMDRREISNGPLFATAGGKPLDRSNVGQCMKQVSRDARVPEEKANPRCLWKMYRSTQESIRATVTTLVEQTYERLWEQEQLAVGWEER